MQHVYHIIARGKKSECTIIQWLEICKIGMQVVKGHTKTKTVVLGYFDLPHKKITDFFIALFINKKASKTVI